MSPRPTDPTPSDAHPPLPRYLAALWGRADDTPRRGPKPTLSIREIGRAAVAIADERGWESVSMKAIAQSLGMTTMSLYRYVESKDDIIDAMVDEAYGRADRAVLDEATWQGRITAWAHAVTERMRQRPWLAAIPLPRPPLGPNALSWTDTGVRTFDGTALRGQQKMNALLLVDGFVRQHVRQSSQMGMLGTIPDGPPYESMLLTLTTPNTHPGISAALADMPDGDITSDEETDFFTEQLDFGLSVIVDGLSALLDH
ncbi:TetR/AcrR family transcriptional regulator [Gordonia sp. NPDC003585]|uniref:TetR/AcrR family transcriptional regulator n=1 Tax=Gordonia sp. NPDC003585 TaxID=3154275 RepID=UPI0033BC3ADF